MDMKKWVTDTIASPTKQALPVLSFPAIQKLGITVAELINSTDNQADAMKVIADMYPTAAAVSFMDLSVEAEAFGSTIVVTDEEVPTVVGGIIDEDTDPETVFVPEVGAGRTGLYIDAIRKVAPLIDDRPVLAGMIGPFSLAGRLMDVNEAIMLCYDEPELVQAVLEKVTGFLIDYAQAFKDAGADGVVIAEPLAGLLPADLISEFSSPYVRRIIDAVQDDEFLVVYHNCGPLLNAVDAILETGASAYHLGNAIKMDEMLASMPSDVLVMGNVDPAGVIRLGTPESVKAATTEVLQTCSSYPNFVISSGCDIPPMSPLENIQAFFDAVDEFYHN